MLTNKSHGGARGGAGRPAVLKDPVKMLVALSTKQHKALKKYATRYGRSSAAVIREALEEFGISE